MATQEQDPFAKWTVKSSEVVKKDDPFAKWTSKSKVEDIRIEEPIEEEIKAKEDEGILSSIGDWLTKSYLPEIGSERPGLDAPGGDKMPFALRVLGETGIEGYNQLIRPMASPAGLALTAFGGPLIRSGVKAASMIPGISKLGSLLGKKVLPGEAPSFIKKTVETLTPKGKVSPKEVTPEVFTPEVTSPTELATIANVGDAPRLAGVMNMGNGIITIQFDRSGAAVTAENIKSMFPNRNIKVVEFPSGILSPHLRKFRIDVMDENNRVSSKVAKELEDEIGGSFKDWPDVNLNKIPRNVIDSSIPIEEVAQQLTPIDKLLGAVKTAKPLEAKQAKIYSAERASRIGQAEKVTTPGQRGFWERKGKLAGEHSKVQMEALKLEQPDIDDLFNGISKSPLEPFQRINAGTGLEKILSGQVPQNSEIQLLAKVFGEDKISQLASALPKIERGDLIHETVNIPRAMQTIYDLSMPLRQGKALIMSRDWFKAWPAMVKSAGSEGAYKGVMDSIMARGNYVTKTLADGTRETPFFRKAGLHLTDLTDLTSREESMMAPIVERTVPLARASNRAAVAFVNKLRADHFDRLITSAEKSGLNPYENLDLSQRIASFVNNATGRGSLGPAEKYALVLNDVFFSPKFIASRVNMLNPVNYLRLNTPEGRFVAKQYWKSAAGLSAAWLTKLKLEEYAGAKVNWDDPTSSDFLKARWGNTTDDPGAGFQQFIVLFNRLAQGSYKTISGREREYGRGFGSKTMLDAIEEFVINKLSPPPKYFADIAGASEYRPFDINDKTIRLVVPMFIQDLSEIAQEDPSLLPLLGGAFLGESVQVTGEEQSKMFGDSIPSLNIPKERVGRSRR